MDNFFTRIYFRIQLVYLLKVCLFILVYLSTRLALADDTKHVNMSHQDLWQEEQRLRSEGVAQYENGIAQKKAKSLFEEVLKLNPRNSINHYNLGVIYRKLNEIEKAKVKMNDAIKLNPKFANPHYVLGIVYLNEGKLDSALEALIKAHRIVPQDPGINYQLSRVYRENGDTEKTLQYIVNTLNADPSHTGAMYQLYLHHLKLQEKEKANQVFSEFSRLKKAVGLSRKEINPDETELAKPIADVGADKLIPFNPKTAPPKFEPIRQNSTIGSTKEVKVYDFNNDYIDDLLLYTEKSIELLLGKPDGSFKDGLKFEFDDRILDVEVAKLVRDQPYSIVVNTASGIFIRTLVSNIETPSEGKKKKIARPIDTIKMSETTQVSKSEASNLNILDWDHDGDLDLVIDIDERIYINDGQGKFSKMDVYQFNSEDKSVIDPVRDLIVGDYRNNVTFDAHLFTTTGKRYLLIDALGGKYTLHTEGIEAKENVVSVATFDMDNDGNLDNLIFQKDNISIEFGNGKHVYDTQDIALEKLLMTDAIVSDYNNDGFKDIIVAIKAGGLIVLRNEDNRSFVQSSVIRSSIEFKDIEQIDLKNDGSLDVAGVDKLGRVHLLRNVTKDIGSWVKLKLEGIRSAPDARNTRVEIRYGGFYTRYEAKSDIVHIPINESKYAELLRISWPNGFVENKLHITSEKNWYFAESERISGSCPSIYAFNGERYKYITDAFISGPMGVPYDTDKYFPTDNEEFLKISGKDIAIDENGRIKISLVEELKEVTYLDHIQLLAVDYPDSMHMFPNEYLQPPNFPDFDIHLTENAYAPAHAYDHTGSEISQLLREVDHKFPHSFSRSSYTGIVDSNAVEIQLTEEEIQSESLRLFMTGWFYYFDSTSLLSTAQNQNLEIIWPTIELKRNGNWEFYKHVGLPSGKDKTVVVNIEGVTPDVSALRIVTNLELYWDQILIDSSEEPSGHVINMNTMGVAEATVRFHGFSELITHYDDHPRPDQFDYHNVSMTSLWNPLEGKYTRYGEVEELLRKEDNLFVVIGSGDEVAMQFDTNTLPPLRTGFRRDYLLYLNGYVKDGDRNTAFAGSVDPMPIVGNSAYEVQTEESRTLYETDRYKTYLEKYQTRSPIRFTDY